MAPRAGVATVCPTISSAKSRADDFARVGNTHHPAAAQDGRAVAQRADLLELVADVEDRRPLGAELAQGREQNLHLLRGQDAGRFVHDQQLRLLQEAPHDLDPLPLTGGEVADRPPGIERQPVLPADLADTRRKLAHRRRVLHPERHVLGHVQRLEQAEVLEHHGDAGAPGFVRARRRVGGAGNLHVPLVGAHQAVHHLDERRFSSTVLAEKSMHVALPDRQGDVVVGTDAGIALADPLACEEHGHRG